MLFVIYFVSIEGSQVCADVVTRHKTPVNGWQGRHKHYYAPRPAEGRAPPKAVNGRGRAGGIVFF